MLRGHADSLQHGQVFFNTFLSVFIVYSNSWRYLNEARV
jgi:hypothetical protein